MKRLLLVFAFIVVALAPVVPASAQSSYATLAEFSKKTGNGARGSLIEGANGVLYGTTSAKAAGFGSVYSLTPPAKGTAWTFKVLYEFQGGKDGAGPECSLVADSSGALYGTTTSGGAAKKWGAVFKLTPPAKGSKDWTETILYSFSGGADGGTPRAGLLLGNDGTLYGTALFGGSAEGDSGFGTVFALTPPAKGRTAWSQTVLYTFLDGPDGGSPVAALTQDASGALYSTTVGGGDAGGWGTVFKVAPPSQGKTQWTESVLYSFAGNADGAFPGANVIFDQSGNLYSTVQDTTGQNGAVFELSPPTGGNSIWTKSMLYTVPQSDYDGAIAAGVIFGPGGVLDGATEGDGTYASGRVFQLTPPSGGQGAWTENDLYDLDGFTGQAIGTYVSLLLTNSGQLVGASVGGGKKNNGVVYEVTP